MKEIRLLRADEIEVKVKQVTQKGAILLLYKNARTDMNILDEVYGADWTNEYKEIGGVLFCGIGIRSNKNEPFVWKWSNGIESREDGGNEKKGEASDAFKRAGFLIGIGRELYTAPFIFVNAETEQDGKNWKLKDRFDKYSVDEIEYNEDRSIKRVVISDQNGNVVFGGKKPPKKANTPKVDDFDTTPEKKPVMPNKTTIDENVVNDILYMANTNGLTDDQVKEWVAKKFKKDELANLTTDEANELIRAITKKREKNVA